MKLILARHGNTFAPGDLVRWVGVRNDLPLAPSGVQQAHQLGRELKALPIAAIYSGSLLRLRSTAEIIASQTGQQQVTVDPRLNELDFGSWSGKTTEQIEALFGAEPIKNWNERGIWPSDAGWAGSEESTVSDLHAFVGELSAKFTDSDVVVIVSSNGKLRYFLTLVAGAFEEKRASGQLKVSTGHLCEIDLPASRPATLLRWNSQSLSEA